MEQLGIADGWHCWEVGVGGPSIPTWLASRVGPSGRVLATDIDIRWAEQAKAADVELLQHDVVHDEPPSGGFDLVHERLVLIHLPEREEALARMVAALRPGGWILVEDFDSVMQADACPDETGPEQRLANKMRKGLRELLAGRGSGPDVGPTPASHAARRGAGRRGRRCLHGARASGRGGAGAGQRPASPRRLRPPRSRDRGGGGSAPRRVGCRAAGCGLVPADLGWGRKPVPRSCRPRSSGGQGVSTTARMCM